MLDPLKGPAQRCQCLRMTHYVQWVGACLHERAENSGSKQMLRQEEVKNAAVVSLYACLPFSLSVILWLEISSLNMKFVMDFLPVVCQAA